MTMDLTERHTDRHTERCEEADGWVERSELFGQTPDDYTGHDCLIVAGFHRSGTSALARTLACAGLFLGERMSGTAKNNRHGYFEDMDVLRLHEQLLSDNGSGWDDPEPFIPYVASDIWLAFADLIRARHNSARPWGFKDPRACLFLPIWKHLLPEAKILVVYRPPEACVASLETRHFSNLIEQWGDRRRDLRFWTEKDLGARLWLRYNEALLRAAEVYGDDVVVVPFSGISEAEAIVATVNQRWGFDLESVRSGNAWDSAAVHHNDVNITVGDADVAMRVRRCFESLDSRAVDLKVLGAKAAIP